MKRISIISSLAILFFSCPPCNGAFESSDGKVELNYAVEQEEDSWTLSIKFKNVSDELLTVVIDQELGLERPDGPIGVLIEPRYSSSGVVYLSSFCSFDLFTVSPGGTVIVKKVKLAFEPSGPIRLVLVVHEDFTKWFGAWSGELELILFDNESCDQTDK